MTYFRFHLNFNGPVLALLLLSSSARDWGDGRWCAAGILLLIVYAFTTPWDNYAVGRGIWGFPPGKYWRKLWRLPVEEYLFFGLQSVQVMLLINVLIGWGWGGAPWAVPSLTSLRVLMPLGVVALIWLMVGLIFRKRAPRFNYAWHLLFWFLPIILVQWVIGWPVLAPGWPLIVVPTLALGAWLSAADFLAVRAGLWYFDDRQVTGFKFGGVLPWEEVAFFHLTSLLVSQSYLLLTTLLRPPA
jgi:lycopene cyclase domain-containing protein